MDYKPYPQFVSNWLINYIFPEARKRKCKAGELGVPLSAWAYILNGVYCGRITSTKGRSLIKFLFDIADINKSRSFNGKERCES